MSRRIPVLPVAVAAATFAAGLVAPAAAGAQAAPRNASLTAVGGAEFKANRYVKDTMRFNRDVVHIRSGGTLTLRNRTDQPHTLSVVKRSDLPRSFRQMEQCFAEDGVCTEIAAAHGVTSPEAEPTTPLVDVGDAGFDRAGDSALFVQDPVRVDITANRGKRLYYLCLIHPWMQGRVNVR